MLSLTTDLPDTRELVTESERIDRILRNLCVVGRAAVLELDSGRQVPVTAAGFDGRHSTWRVERAVSTAKPAQLLASGYNSGFVLPLERAQLSPTELVAERPSAIVRVRSRSHRRFAAARGARVLVSSLGALKMRDISQSGISFLVPDDTAGLTPGISLGTLVVQWPGFDNIQLRGVVRYVALVDGRRMCGVELTPVGAREQHLWQCLVASSAYVHTRHGADPSELWELFIRSGYLDLGGRSPDAFGTLRSAFIRATERLNQARDVGTHVIWPGRDGLEGVVTMVKPYAYTWYGYQLARRRDRKPRVTPRTVLREVLLHGYEYPLNDPSFRWMVTWVRDDGRFSRALMRDLTARFTADSTRADIVSFRALYGSALDGETSQDPSIRVADQSDRGLLFQALEKSRSVAYREAHDLAPDRFDLSSTKDHWRRAGMSRSREVLALTLEGQTRAVAVCETVDEGLHLYGLFDVVRLFSVSPGGERTFARLLRGVRRWYGTRRAQGCAFFCEEPYFDFALEAGFEDMGAADMTILSSDYMADQLEHAWELTAPKADPR